MGAQSSVIARLPFESKWRVGIRSRKSSLKIEELTDDQEEGSTINVEVDGS